ncbi:MAG TPA: ATP-binding protein [Solirubrobacteraceae bacterium]
MKAPIAFVHGNCVFASGLRDAWAVFVLEPSSYAWSTDEAKRGRFVATLGALEGLAADVQILRVTREWSVERYARRVMTEVPGSAMAGYVTSQALKLNGVGAAQPSLFIAASLSDPQRDVGSALSDLAAHGAAAAWRQRLTELFEAREQRALSPRELKRIVARATRVRAQLADFLPIREAVGAELQWLIRRAFCRGLGELEVELAHEPRAISFERNGKAMLAPLEGDVLRWMNSYVEQRPRLLKVESERGLSWQAHLVVGALPDSVHFPGPEAELMFAPVESLPFGVDLALTARVLPNELAIKLVRRRAQDAEQIARSESEGELGVSDLGYRRTEAARELLSQLQASSRPPLLRASLAVAVAAATEAELEQRVELCRRAYGRVRLHRPLGAQLALFSQHLPGQRARVAGYDDTLTAGQVAAMMPDATHAAGSRRGLYLGHTLSGSRQPVLFNLREGSDEDRNTAILSLGSLGAGKTTLAQKLAYEAFLSGARVIDCDPKGDHRFHLLEDVAPHVEQISLRADPAMRGMLDPLCVAPNHLRHDAAVAFMRDLLPVRAEPSWETALVRSVDRVISRALRPTCLEVVKGLLDGDPVEREVGRTLETYARSGLTQLGFADALAPPPSVGLKQVTYLAIRDLPVPLSGTRRSEYSLAERVGEQVVRLIAMFAMQLMGEERERLKVFSFDEGWRLLGDPVGRSLLVSLQRMGRSDLAVPIISTQLLTDALVGERESIENLVGATFVFGVRSRAEAARALALLGLDPQDRAKQQILLELDAGRCLFRDHRGRIEAVQVELLVPQLVEAFSTTPSR